jgi:hypothetical protein
MVMFVYQRVLLDGMNEDELVTLVIISQIKISY